MMTTGLYMRKWFLVIALLCCTCQVLAQSSKCGLGTLDSSIGAVHPDFMKKVKRGLFTDSTQFKGQVKYFSIPIVFHIVLNQSQFTKLGNEAGIKKRIDSQLLVINRDFNAGNADSMLIPLPFKPLYAKVGLSFELAHTMPNGKYTPGYEIIVSDRSGFELSGGYGSGYAFSAAKYNSGGGFDAWDVNSYLNIWIINPLENGKASGFGGLTIPVSYTGSTTGIPDNERGIVLHYGAFGVRTNFTEYFVGSSTEGRTLTHELGHLFELRHVWGDDDGLCPGQGFDDGIDDTPPQASATIGCPSFPFYDSCTTSGNGIMFMNYMDYTIDNCMHLFTVGQAQRMNYYVQPGKEMYSLTQHPDLLKDGETSPNAGYDFKIVPNPTKENINIIFSKVPVSLKSICITNAKGETIWGIETAEPSAYYHYDCSGTASGVYFVRSVFSDKTMVKKLFVE